MLTAVDSSSLRPTILSVRRSIPSHLLMATKETRRGGEGKLVLPSSLSHSPLGICIEFRKKGFPPPSPPSPPARLRDQRKEGGRNEGRNARYVKHATTRIALSATQPDASASPSVSGRVACVAVDIAERGWRMRWKRRTRRPTHPLILLLLLFFLSRESRDVVVVVVVVVLYRFSRMCTRHDATPVCRSAAASVPQSLAPLPEICERRARGHQKELPLRDQLDPPAVAAVQ